MQPQQLKLTDALWLAGHDTAGRNARLKAADRPFAATLAGGLLAELTLGEYTSIDQDGLHLRRWSPMGDHALDPVVAELFEEERPLHQRWQAAKDERTAATQQWLAARPRHQAPYSSAWQDPAPFAPEEWAPPAHDLSVWVQFLAAENKKETPPTLAERHVVERLSRAGHLDVINRTVPVGPRVRYRPKNSATSGAVAVRLMGAIESNQQLSQADLFLAGLITASGLHLDAFASMSPVGYATCHRRLDRDLTSELRMLLDVVEGQVSSATHSGRL
jgi:hypothetical protein